MQPECISEEKDNNNECLTIESSDIDKQFASEIIDDYRTGLLITKEAMSDNINQNFEKITVIFKNRNIQKAESLNIFLL